MHSSKIIINNHKFEGTLDFYVLKKVQEDLLEHGYNYTISDIFKNLSDLENLNMYIVMSLLLNSIVRYSNIDEEELEKEFNKDTLDLNKFNLIFEYINKLLVKCMPKNTNNEDLFEEEDDIEVKEDWDFEYMEYLWYSILKRQDDFYKVTPKTFFSQMNIYKKMNNVKEDNVKYL